MKYRTRVETYDAQQFHPDQKPWPAGVTFGTLPNTKRLSHMLTDHRGLITPILPGTWIVSREEVTKAVAPERFDLIFREEFHAERVADEVLDERVRQIVSEGYLFEHDDAHNQGQLARAAGCYVEHAGLQAYVRDAHEDAVPPAWPWDDPSWKPTTPRRDLIKAAALLLAEVERIDRAAQGAEGRPA